MATVWQGMECRGSGDAKPEQPTQLGVGAAKAGLDRTFARNNLQLRL